MSLIRNVALAVLAISFLTFIVLFGRLPALRYTPIGFLHRLIWLYAPSVLRSIDEKLTGGRLSSSTRATAHFLWNERHPVVVIFFLLLLAIPECMFIPVAWNSLTLLQKTISICLIPLPYAFLWIAAASDPGYITASNLSHKLTLYPYDFTIYQPGHICSTCKTLKPARSKHCKICNRCISRMDHHCIFINNCVGYNNHHWFLLLLLSTATLTTWGTYVGTSLLSAFIREKIPSWTIFGSGIGWSRYFEIWKGTLQERPRISAITLLALLLSPLVWGLLGYHVYLIWAGTTTNETIKWDDWQAEMSDGYVFKRALSAERQKSLKFESAWTSWPVESQQILLRTTDGASPSGPKAIGVGEWERVWQLKNLENLYDLGFWDNFRDILFARSTHGDGNPQHEQPR